MSRIVNLILSSRQGSQWLCRFRAIAAACLLLVASLLTSCASINVSQYDFAAMLEPVPLTAKWADTNFNIWCGSAAQGDDRKYRLFYSRWPRALGHKAWVTYSGVARAVSDPHFGPWQHREVALPARGTNFWDGPCTHNRPWQRLGQAALDISSGTNFTKRGYSLALWKSADGFDWELSKHPFVVNPSTIRWVGGHSAAFNTLGRPQFLFDNGLLIALLCAAADAKDRVGSFNVQIRLQPTR